MRETAAKRNKREATGGEAFFLPLPKPPASHSLQFFRGRLFRATFRLPRKDLLAFWVLLIERQRYSFVWQNSPLQNYGKTGTSEGLWDRLGRRMEISRMNKSISRQSVVKEILFYRLKRFRYPEKMPNSRTYLSARCSSVYQTIPQSITRTSLLTVS